MTTSWRTVRWPKPEAKVKVATPLKRNSKPIARRTRPRVRMPSAAGDFKARVKYANDLWRDLIRAKEPGGICPMCRKRPWHDGAHCFIKGRHHVVRFEPDDGAPLCRPCHRIIDSDHHAKTEFFMRYIGVEAYERLRLRTVSRSKLDLGLMIMFLEAETLKAKAMFPEWPVRPRRRE